MRFFLWSLCFFCTTITHCFAWSNADGEVLDANQHVIIFEKGVDAFNQKEYNKALHFWLPLARAGDMMAARNMALLYHKGLGIEQDLEEAELFYRLAADNGVTDAQTILGILLIKGNELKRNIPDAIKYLTAASKAGDPIASWNLGLIYENGIEVNKNLEKAMSLFQTAARSGYEPAIIKISGKPQDVYASPKDALKNYQNKNQQSNNSVDNNVFNKNVESAIPVTKTFEEKVALDKKHDAEYFSDKIHFNRDAQSDDPDVGLKTDLGEYKKVQTGLDQDLDPFGVGISKKNRLSEEFNTDTVDNIGQLKQAEELYNAENYKKAKKIWEKLFNESRLDEAAFRLGQLYTNGMGVEQNLFKAYAYWKKGADAGGKLSASALEEFRSVLNDEKLLEYEQKTMSFQ